VKWREGDHPLHTLPWNEPKGGGSTKGGGGAKGGGGKSSGKGDGSPPAKKAKA
jgi:hypothetical protein